MSAPNDPVENGSAQAEAERSHSLLGLTTLSLRYPGGPTPRSGHRMVATENDVYLVGGYNRRCCSNLLLPAVPIVTHLPICFRELWRYNIAAQEWNLCKTTGKFPVEVISHSAVLHGNNLIVYGGTGVNFGEELSNKAHVINLKALDWKELETKGNKPPPLYGQAVLLHEDNLYTIGGTDGTVFHMDIHKLNLITLTWEAVYIAKGYGVEAFPRYRHFAFYHAGKIFIIGGGQNVGYDPVFPPPAPMNTLPAFDLEKKVWVDIDALPFVDNENNVAGAFPASRISHSCVQHGDSVYMTGGRNQDGVFADLWKLHLPTMQWSLLALQLYHLPLSFHDMAVTPAGCLYTFGGLNYVQDSDSLRVRDFTKVWVALPTLEELVWELLVEKTNVTKKGRTAVAALNLGIPKEFLERIPLIDEHQLTSF